MYKGIMRVWVDGSEIELYTIGHTAKILKKSVETIRAWERQKVIPKPMYKNKNVRLYHPMEVEAMKKVLRKLGKYAKKEDIKKEIYAALRITRLKILEPSTHESDQNGT